MAFPDSGRSPDRRGALAEKARRGAENAWHGGTLYRERADGRDKVLEVENGDPEDVALGVFPITVAGSILNARHGTRHTALIPEQDQRPKERKEGEAKGARDEASSSIHRMILDFSGFSPPIGFGVARDSDLYDRPITDVMLFRILLTSKIYRVDMIIDQRSTAGLQSLIPGNEDT